MKKLTAAAALVAGAFMVSQAAQAQVVENDLYMGFENPLGGGTQDYIINLGPASSLTGLIGEGVTVNLSSDFSMADFTSAGLSGSNPATIVGGVVGGSNGNTPSDLYVTQFRSGGTGGWGVPGSTAPAGVNRFEINNGYADISQLNSPAAGTGLLDGSKSWEAYVENGGMPMGGTFYGDTGANPDSTVGTALYEDLWQSSNSNGLGADSPFTYDGYFTLDLSGASPSLTFTPAPEPSSYIISAAGGILLLLLRSRSWRKQA